MRVSEKLSFEHTQTFLVNLHVHFRCFCAPKHNQYMFCVLHCHFIQLYRRCMQMTISFSFLFQWCNIASICQIIWNFQSFMFSHWNKTFLCCNTATGVTAIKDNFSSREFCLQHHILISSFLPISAH